MPTMGGRFGRRGSTAKRRSTRSVSSAGSRRRSVRATGRKRKPAATGGGVRRDAVRMPNGSTPRQRAAFYEGQAASQPNWKSSTRPSVSTPARSTSWNRRAAGSGRPGARRRSPQRRTR